MAVDVFDGESRPGDMETFHALENGILIVCAPGGPMLPEAQDAPTDVVLYLRRANPLVEKGGLAPPAPLADPLLDINIQPGMAKSYEVRKGQFMQVLDVQGRECSDFQAFSQRALDRRPGARNRSNNNAQPDGRPVPLARDLLEILVGGP